MNGYPRFGWVDILRFQHIKKVLYDAEGKEVFSDDRFGLNKNQIDRPGLAKSRLFL